MDGYFWNFDGMSEMAQTTSDSILGGSGRNPGSLWNFRYHCIKEGIREPLAKRRWWRHLTN